MLKNRTISATENLAPMTSLVLNYEHPELVERLRRELSLSADEASELFLDLKKFLLVCSLHSEVPFVPPKKIDAAWHNFILYTNDYTKFCSDFFGEHIHHLPFSYLAHKSHDCAFAKTLSIAVDLFGELGNNWKTGQGASCRACTVPTPRSVAGSSAR